MGKKRHAIGSNADRVKTSSKCSISSARSFVSSCKSAVRSRMRPSRSSSSYSAVPEPVSFSEAPPTPAPQPGLFPILTFLEIGNSPRPVYVSLSSDIRLIEVRADLRDSKATSSAPTSILDFRKPYKQFSLERLPDEKPSDTAASTTLKDRLEQRVRSTLYDKRPAVFIPNGGKQGVYLIFADEGERDDFAFATLLRVTPWTTMCERIKTELRDQNLPTSSTPTSSSSSGVERGFFTGGTEVSADNKEKRLAEWAGHAWKNAGTVAETLIWTATCAQGIGSVAHTAQEVEKLTRPLGQLTIVGCAFSIVALSARVVGLIALEREGKAKLAKERDELKNASLLLFTCLLSLFGSGLRDNDMHLSDAFGIVFGVYRDCWMCADKLEQYIMRSWASRVWKVEDVRTIISDVESLNIKLISVGLFTSGFKLMAGIEAKLNEVETAQAAGEDQVSLGQSTEQLGNCSPVAQKCKQISDGQVTADELLVLYQGLGIEDMPASNLQIDHPRSTPLPHDVSNLPLGGNDDARESDLVGTACDMYPEKEIPPSLKKAHAWFFFSSNNFVVLRLKGKGYWAFDSLRDLFKAIYSFNSIMAAAELESLSMHTGEQKALHDQASGRKSIVCFLNTTSRSPLTISHATFSAVFRKVEVINSIEAIRPLRFNSVLVEANCDANFEGVHVDKLKSCGTAKLRRCNLGFAESTPCLFGDNPERWKNQYNVFATGDVNFDQCNFAKGKTAVYSKHFKETGRYPFLFFGGASLHRKVSNLSNKDWTVSAATVFGYCYCNDARIINAVVPANSFIVLRFTTFQGMSRGTLTFRDHEGEEQEVSYRTNLFPHWTIIRATVRLVKNDN